MAKKPTNEKRVTEEEKVTGYFEHFNPEGAKPAAKAEPVIDSGALNEQIKALTAQVDTLQSANYSLMTQPAASAVAPAAPDPAPMSLDDLPDAVTEPEAYTKALTERIVSMTSKESATSAAAVATAANEKAQMSGLWDDFEDRYAEKGYDDEEKVGYAAYRVAGKARKRGMDVNKYAYQTRDKFFSDVTAEYDKTFGKPGEEPATTKETAPKDDEADRAAFMFGGEAGAKVTPTKPEKGDMFSDLAEIQAKMRLY